MHKNLTIMETFIVNTVFTHLEQKINLKTIKMYVYHDYCHIEIPKENIKILVKYN